MVRIFGQFVPRTSLVLGIVEAFLVSALLYFEIVTLHSSSETILTDQAIVLSSGVSLSIIFVMYSSGLYLDDALTDTRMFVLRSLPVLGLVLLLGATVVPALIPYEPIHRGSWMYLLPGTWLIGILVTRPLFWWVTSLGTFRRRVLILGNGRRATRLTELAKHKFGAKFVIVGQVNLGARVSRAVGGDNAVARAVEATDLLDLVAQSKTHEIILATEDRRDLPMQELLRCKLAGVPITDYLDFYERETGRLDLSTLRSDWLVASDGFRGGRVADVIKRGFDIGVGLLIFGATMPVLVLTAAAIWCESGGPIFYRQERVGFNGKRFVLLKFRSMIHDAEKQGPPIWAMKGDPRVTKVGWLIRKLRIDELPQLYNVLRGDMSLVGPRPERPYFVDRLAQTIPFYLERHSVKPGITGWAQVNYRYGASVEDAKKKLSYDLYYVKNRRLLLDLIILVRTFRVVFWFDSAR